MTTIRQEYDGDFEAIREVNEEAFNQPDEADLMDALRESDHIVVSLVAEKNREVVGHICLSEASIDEYDLKVAGLAPMAVLPEYQNRGIGTLLVEEGLDECLSRGYAAVIVLGHVAFYSRFGFKPASEFGIRSEWEEIQEDAFMVLELHAGALDGVEGIARYADEFSEIT